MAWITGAAGLAILLLAGDLLVRGAVGAAPRLGIPAFVVSLTVVALGTSAPELLLSIQAVLGGAPGLALGNVVGSNTANVLLVLGVPALISRLRTKETDCRKSYVTMLGASAVFFLLCMIGPLNWVHGVILLVILVLVVSDQVRHAASHRRTAGLQPVETSELQMRLRTIALFLVLGIAGLPLGAGLLVDAAVEMAGIFGVSDSAIGLTIVAIGTSLPELGTTTMAVVRRNVDVALGNVIGSNLFNLLLIAGGAALFGAIPVPREFLVFDLWCMLGASVLLAPFVFFRKWEMTRRFGVLFTVLYVVYVILVVQHG
ncbi:MAG: calcium/sodium antiporter [Boseongicola sp.]|nr:calcium/sodium antiporter [Boseongicola sp.]